MINILGQESLVKSFNYGESYNLTFLCGRASHLELQTDCTNVTICSSPEQNYLFFSFKILLTHLTDRDHK